MLRAAAAAAPPPQKNILAARTTGAASGRQPPRTLTDEGKKGETTHPSWDTKNIDLSVRILHWADAYLPTYPGSIFTSWPPSRRLPCSGGQALGSFSSAVMPMRRAGTVAAALSTL